MYLGQRTSRENKTQRQTMRGGVFVRVDKRDNDNKEWYWEGER